MNKFILIILSLFSISLSGKELVLFLDSSLREVPSNYNLNILESIDTDQSNYIDIPTVTTAQKRDLTINNDSLLNINLSKDNRLVLSAGLLKAREIDAIKISYIKPHNVIRIAIKLTNISPEEFVILLNLFK